MKRLQDCLLAILEWANAEASSVKRVESFNRGKSVCLYEVEDKLLLRDPQLRGSFEASWEGYYDDVERVSKLKVNYRISKSKEKRATVVHVNNTKKFVEKVSVNTVFVVQAEEKAEMDRVWSKNCVWKEELCAGFSEEMLMRMLNKLKDFFSDSPGLCSVGSCTIIVEEGNSVVNLPPHQKVPLGIREAVDKEV